MKKKEEKNNLSKALANIEKRFGKVVIDSKNKIQVEAIPSGSMNLDKALGVNGLARGRIIEVFGGESTGKTTLALTVCKKAQELGLKVAYLDAENSFNFTYAETIGINIDDAIIVQPSCGEETLDIARELVNSNEVGLIIIDSVSALVPKAELEGTMEDNTIGLQARLMSQAMRMLAGEINRSNTCVVFINQLREKMALGYGSPITTSGGRALRFYASVRIQLKRIKAIKKGDEVIGSEIQAEIKKNKVAPPFKKAEFDIYFTEGISEIAEVLKLAIKQNIIKKAGAWFSYKDNKWQGEENARLALKEDKELFKEIKNAIF